MKVSHSTRTANLQLVDPACAAAQEHVETRIWNFHFSFFIFLSRYKNTFEVSQWYTIFIYLLKG